MKKEPIIILFATMFIVMVGFGLVLPVLPFVSMKMGRPRSRSAC